MATTNISDFFSTIRFLVGDRDQTIRTYSDEVLLDSVRACIRLQKVPGYALAVDTTQITPEVTDVNKWALVAYHVVKAFIESRPDRFSFSTRAMSQTFGSYRMFLDELNRSIYKLENGTMFSGWTNYYTWLSGISGLPLDLIYAQFGVNAPFYSATLGVDGMSTS